MVDSPYALPIFLGFAGLALVVHIIVLVRTRQHLRRHQRAQAIESGKLYNWKHHRILHINPPESPVALEEAVEKAPS